MIFDRDTQAVAPRWSPDSQRILFHTIDEENRRRVYVAGAAGVSVRDSAAQCRPRGAGGGATTAGFPLPDRAPSAVGTVRIGVLFMDFPDAQATHTTQEEAAQGLPWAEDYLETVSYGLLGVEFVPHHRWLRAEQRFVQSTAPTSEGSEELGIRASMHAVALADDEVDFSKLDMVLTVFPGTRFSTGNAGGYVTADGVTIATSRVNTTPLDQARELADWGWIGAHEIVHNLGLLDLYPYDARVHDTAGSLPHGKSRAAAKWATTSAANTRRLTVRSPPIPASSPKACSCTRSTRSFRPGNCRSRSQATVATATSTTSLCCRPANP